jgi:hypothetical protein
MAHISRFERSQLLLLPDAIDDYVGIDSSVRFINAFVDGLELAEAGFGRGASPPRACTGSSPTGVSASNPGSIV